MPDHRVAGVRVSPREIEVLAALGEYQTNPEIAARLFISIRTVESHVSSLLRKLGVSDRRALATIAAQAHDASDSPRGAAVPPHVLTSLVGRVSERAELLAALGAHRLVTVVGPGGVGKTRLALAATEEMAPALPDGVRYVDLVTVADDSMVAQAVTSALGLAEQGGHSVAETIASWAAERQVLLVLDNCEHVVDGVVTLVEQLLGRSLGITVLATSRVRLMVPFEQAFPVVGLSLLGGEASQLFIERAAAAGASHVRADRERVDRICRALDGVPLAIELAAARVSAVGLDGIEAGLGDQLSLLTGARRVDDRHRSLRSALDWSYALLTERAKVALRRVSVFATGFRLDAADGVVSWSPLESRDVIGCLAVLVDHNLLTAVPLDGTRYVALEAVRQYGIELLAEADEELECRTRHLRWCCDDGTHLLAADLDEASRRAWFERIADELRWALGWAGHRTDRRAEAHDVATVLAALCHRRGLLAEAQRRSEQAAGLAESDRAAALALHRAAGSAQARHAGDDAIRLHRAAGEAALRAGEPALAACELARVVELVYRSPGIIIELPNPDTVRATLADAQRFAGEDLLAQARVATAEAFAGSARDPLTITATDHALELARRCGDPLVESVALDQVTGVQLVHGEVRAALASARRRTEILAHVAFDAELGFELNDAYGMATEASIAAGELTTARQMAERCRDLPQNRELGHLATARLIVVTALTGDWDVTLANGAVFLDGWEEAGRPRLSTLLRAARAMATLCGIRGDTTARKRWSSVIDALTPIDRAPPGQRNAEFFDAWLLLHHEDPDGAARRLTADLRTDFPTSSDCVWLPWYAALKAEAAVLSGQPTAADVLDAARAAVVGNPVTTALVDRAAALDASDRAAVLAAGDRLLSAGCRYQWARSLILAGGPERDRGSHALAALGATLG